MERMHNEITCPYCRIQFGGYKVDGKKVTHLDIMWSYESGLIRDCLQPDLVLTNAESVDDRGNPKFKPEFDAKLKDLREKFDTDPDDIYKDNTDFDGYYVSFVECLNYGSVDGDNEEYDRKSMTGERLKELYESGTNLKEALRSFIVESKE